MNRPPKTPSPALTRRAWLEACFRPLQAAAGPVVAPPAPPAPSAQSLPGIASPALSQVAVIAGRHCLAYQNSFCTTCSERCPVPGAIVIEQGLPRVVAEKCTGCEVCHEVCPSPERAIRMVPKRPMA